MNNIDNNPLITKALELLPWYTLGLLDTQDEHFVKKALIEYPELQDHLNAEHEMALYLREDKELFSLSATEDRERRLKLLLQREELQPKNEMTPHHESNNYTRIQHFIRSLFSSGMTKPQYIGVVATTIVSVALLLALAVPLFEHKSTFHPAAVAPDSATAIEKNTLLIGLNVAPDDPRLLKILDRYEVKTTLITGKDNMYRLSFTHNKPNPADLKELVSTLSKHTDLVWFVGEAY